MSTGGMKQDMPPKGGYDPIDWARKLPKKPANGFLIMGGLTAFTLANFAIYKYFRANKLKLRNENREARIALFPFLLSERNRLYLRYLRRNREEEEKLMKDVPTWEVGKWHDYPVYHNPRGLWIDPTVDDFYMHLSYSQAQRYKELHHEYV